MSVNEKTVLENNDIIEGEFDDSLLAAFGNSDFDNPSTSKSYKNKSVNSSKDLDSNDFNISPLCCDEELDGYDKQSGKIWIYPINVQERDYQFNITRAALVKNTLVSLPTGLGKTFIAAVLMYNFYRWYPLGKIVFTAPTRPLITQQMEACYKLIAMPPGHTIEMTGSMSTQLRKDYWISKRVFFATPQVVCNDILSGICPAKKIRCLVVDEAHKAKNNYSYCQLVSLLNDRDHRLYRVLALSATPGNRVDDVIKVVQNLQIAHIEMRSENCIDVAPYCHSRKINIVVIELGPELTRLRQQYIEIMDKYARRLKQMNYLPDNIGNLSKGRMIMLYKELQKKPSGHPQAKYAVKDMIQLITLYHGLELLVKHSCRSFLKYFDEHPEKAWIQVDDRLTALLEKLRDDLGVDPLSLNTDFQPDGTIPEVPNNLNFGHPKFAKVKEIMIDHFQRAKQNDEDTRAIVFCEYHETVNLVYCLLLQCRPLILPRKFVGQGAGRRAGGSMPQSAQRRALEQFRAGGCTALVATCVGEEGLDVGAVDLVLCFDVASRSAVRLVQRCGRTGRQRSGQIYFLVTKGKEHQTLLDGMRQKDGLNNKILNSKEVKDSLYKLNPRMIPQDFMPECQKMFITAKEREGKGKKRKKNVHIQPALDKPSTSTGAGSTEIENVTKDTTDNESYKVLPQNHDKLICDDKLNTPRAVNTDITVKSTLTKSDEQPKKIKTTDKQTKIIKNSSPIKKTSLKEKRTATNPVKQNGDIRALFTKGRSTQEYAKALNSLQIQNEDMPPKLVNLLVSIAIENKSTKTCYICNNIGDCQLLHNLRKNIQKRDSINLDREPDLWDVNLTDNVDSESIRKCLKQEPALGTSTTCQLQNDNVVNSSTSKQLCENEKAILEKQIPINNIERQFDIGDVDDIFADDSPVDEVFENNKVEDGKHINHNSNQHVHSSFELGSVDEIFTDDIFDDESPKCKRDNCEGNFSDGNPNSSKDTKPMGMRSPSILIGSHTNSLDTRKSPILGFQSKRKRKKSIEISHSATPTNLSNSMHTITQTLDFINNYNNSLNSPTKTKYDGRISPILQTQADKKNIILKREVNEKNNTQSDAIIICSSDSDTDTDTYIPRQSPSSKTKKNSNQKRTIKHEIDEHSASPYFPKRLKKDDCNNDKQSGRSSTTQEKVLAALTFKNFKRDGKFSNNTTNFNVIIPECLKENINQNIQMERVDSKDIKQEVNSFYLGNKYSFSPKKSCEISKTPGTKMKSKFDKRRLKRRSIVKNFLDLEAELSEDGASGSEDEMSDQSAGSIVDFITDNELTQTDVDMQAHYIKSIKSPLKHGAFKIPVVLKQKEDIGVYSQVVEEDNYEMDSFCVDSLVGFTQVNDLSELELAEMILEQKRKKKKKSRIIGNSFKDSCLESSPEIKPKKRKRYNVLSDSDDDN